MSVNYNKIPEKFRPLFTRDSLFKDPMVIPEEVYSILDILFTNRIEAYLVGGSVRDIILGMHCNDWDIAVNVNPYNLRNTIFKDYSTSYIKKGTLVIYLGDNLHIELTGYKGTENTIEDDLHHRDFTINALAYCPSKSVICSSGIKDPLNGLKDLSAGVIKTCLDPKITFSDDYLRILRAIRFASLLGFTISDETRHGIFTDYKHLLAVHNERKKNELDKILIGKAFPAVLSEYLPVLTVDMPGIDELNYYSEDELKSLGLSMLSLANITLRWALFFIKEERLSVDMDINNQDFLKTTKTAMENLAFGNEEKERILGIMEHYYDFEKYGVSNISVKKILNQIGLMPVHDIILLKGAENTQSSYELAGKVNDELDRILQNNECYNRYLLNLKGDQFDQIPIDIPLKDRKKYLNLLVDAVIEGKVPNQKDALKEYLLSIVEA